MSVKGHIAAKGEKEGMIVPCRAYQKACPNGGLEQHEYFDSIQELEEFSELAYAIEMGEPISEAKAEKYRDLKEASQEYRVKEENLQEVLKAVGEKTNLFDFDYGDQFSDEQSQMYLTDDWDGETAEKYEEWESRSRWAAASDLLQEKLDELEIEEDEIDYAEAIEAIMDKDTSDPLTTLARMTPPKLMRAPLFNVSFEDPDFPEEAYGSPYLSQEARDARTEFVAKKLQETFPEASKEELYNAADEMVIQGPEYVHEGVQVHAIFTSDLNTAKNVKLDAPDGVNLVLLDRWNGSGWESKVESPASFSTKGITLDNQDGGYGWDEIAGVNPSAYNTTLERNEEAFRKKQTDDVLEYASYRDRGPGGFATRADVESFLDKAAADLKIEKNSLNYEEAVERLMKQE